MIDSRELRIGNLIGTPDGIKRVDGVASYYKNPVISCDGNSWREESVTPLSITPDILEKCGFEKIHTGSPTQGTAGVCFKNEKIRLIESGGFANPMYYIISTVFGCPKIIYLHQLQNLYYSLTGQELTITL